MMQISPQSIYLDNAATTQLAPPVLEAMRNQLENCYANPASMHTEGRAAAEFVAQAREQVANLIGARPEEIVWTCGATEANNLAIKGAADFYQREQRKTGHIVSLTTEHKAVLDPLRELESRGWRITRLTVDAQGLVNPSDLQQVLTADTALISVMQVNNEIGVIQDIAAIGKIAATHGAMLHVDAAQSLGKLPIDVDLLGVDMLSMSAHKLHGPKGIGGLYVRQRPKARVSAQIHGGGHEQGLRSGTQAPHQIAGFAAACVLAGSDMADEQARIVKLRDRLWAKLAALPGVIRNGDRHQAVAGILNVSFEGVHGEALLAGITGGEQALAVSAGSACSAASAQSSYVLRALGRDSDLAAASLRISLGRFSTLQDIDIAAQKICYEVERLRALSPLWTSKTPLAQSVPMPG